MFQFQVTIFQSSYETIMDSMSRELTYNFERQNIPCNSLSMNEIVINKYILLLTNSNKQIHITVGINVNYLPKLFIMLTINLLMNEKI